MLYMYVLIHDDFYIVKRSRLKIKAFKNHDKLLLLAFKSIFINREIELCFLFLPLVFFLFFVLFFCPLFLFFFLEFRINLLINYLVFIVVINLDYICYDIYHHIFDMLTIKNMLVLSILSPPLTLLIKINLSISLNSLMFFLAHFSSSIVY